MAVVSQFIDPSILIRMTDKQLEVIDGIVLGELATNKAFQEAIAPKLRSISAELKKKR